MLETLKITRFVLATSFNCRLATWTRVIAYLAIITILTSCRTGAPTPPTGPSSAAATTRAIQPPTAVLKVLETETYSLAETSGTGQTVVAAAWTSDRPEVVEIDDRGVATAKAVGRATITATTNAGKAVLVVQVVEDFGGEWTGQMRVVEDVRTSGTGPFRPAVGWTPSFAFSLRQTHDVVSGSGVVFTITAPVQGSISSDGQLHLTGTFTTAEGYEAELTDWASQIDDGLGTRMSGHLTITERFRNAWGPQVIQKRCEIARLAR